MIQAALPRPAARGRPWYGRLTTKQEVEFYLAISPWLIGFVLFTGGPILAALLISFTQWQIIDTPKWVGLGNYAQLFRHDTLFWTSIVNTAYYVVVSVPLGLIGSVLVALLLNQKVRGVALFRTIFYLPSVTSGVAMAILWVWLFNPEVGLINSALRFVGLPGPGWLNDQHWAMPAIIIMSLLGVGGNMVVLLAGLQGIPQHLYEAAKLDGANPWQEFLHVTLPMLSPVIFFVLVVSTIGAFQIFTNVYVMTGGSGGPGTATLVYVLYLYQNAFQYLRMGYASAMAEILFLIILGLTIAQFATARRWVYYESAGRDGKGL
jgi:multiple sugar transport system permease protein